MAATTTPVKKASSAAAAAANAVSPEAFVEAFNKQRTTLAGFATCSNREELDIVRDGFYLGLAKDLCPDAYKAVLVMVLRKRFGREANASVTNGSNKPDNNNDNSGGIVVEEGNQGFLSMSFEEMVLAARVCDDEEEESSSSGDEKRTTTSHWKDLVASVLAVGESVGSDLASIWKTLEDGRLNWLGAASAAHPIKTILKKALEDDGALDSPGDVSDAMMVWIYSICLALSTTTSNAAATAKMKIAVDEWVTAVNMTDKHNPLKGYRAESWDPRRDEWRALDIGAREAAESGGTSISEAWKA